MPGENLSRDEARERAALLSVDGYEVALDLRSAVGEHDGDGPRTFRSVTTIRFRCAEPGAASFADLIAPGVTAVSLNGKDLDPGEVFDGSRIAVRFQYESHDAAGQWWRSYGNELWEFDEAGLMMRREASINDLRIDERERRIFGPRPDDERGVEFPLR